MYRFFLVLIVLIFGVSLQAQSPWTQEQGSGFGQFSLISIPPYNTFFDNMIDGGRVSERRYSEIITQIYAEYGILGKTTLVLDAPFKILSAGELENAPILPTEAGTLAALGNIRLGIRQNILDDGLQLTAQLMAELPTGRYDDATGLRTGFDALTLLPMLSVGGGFGKSYVYGYGGVGFRTNEYSTIWNTGFEAGFNASEQFWAMIFFDVMQSLENGNRIDPPNNLESGFYVNNQSWASLGLKLLYNFNDNIGLSFSTTLSAFAGNQVAESPSLAIGVFTEW